MSFWSSGWVLPLQRLKRPFYTKSLCYSKWLWAPALHLACKGPQGNNLIIQLAQKQIRISPNLIPYFSSLQTLWDCHLERGQILCQHLLLNKHWSNSVSHEVFIFMPSRQKRWHNKLWECCVEARLRSMTQRDSLVPLTVILSPESSNDLLEWVGHQFTDAFFIFFFKFVTLYTLLQ